MRYPIQVINENSVLKVSNGHAMLQHITAAGCTVTALIAAFLTLLPNDLHMATAYALGLFGCISPCYHSFMIALLAQFM